MNSQCTLGSRGRSAQGEPILAALLLIQSIHIDPGTLGGAALLHGWVKSQLALAALCGHLPQSADIRVTVRAAQGKCSSLESHRSCFSTQLSKYKGKLIKHDCSWGLNVGTNVAA